jgi:hypothetical protein
MNEHSGLNVCCILVWFEVDYIIVFNLLSKLEPGENILCCHIQNVNKYNNIFLLISID